MGQTRLGDARRERDECERARKPSSAYEYNDFASTRSHWRRRCLAASMRICGTNWHWPITLRASCAGMLRQRVVTLDAVGRSSSCGTVAAGVHQWWYMALFCRSLCDARLGRQAAFRGICDALPHATCRSRRMLMNCIPNPIGRGCLRTGRRVRHVVS